MSIGREQLKTYLPKFKKLATRPIFRPDKITRRTSILHEYIIDLGHCLPETLKAFAGELLFLFLISPRIRSSFNAMQTIIFPLSGPLTIDSKGSVCLVTRAVTKDMLT